MANDQQQSCQSSPLSERKGAQEPRRRFEDGAVVGSDADDCCALGEALGMSLFPWQRAVVDDWCSYDSADCPAYVTCGLDVPRQNGKNASLEVYEMYRLAVCGWHILHTAHRVKTTKKAFHRLVKYFSDDRHPEMQELVLQIRRTNGEEAIYLHNGGSIEFVSRTNGSARGYDDIQLVVYDEAQELTDAQYDAISYTLSASSTGERQTLYMGTPPNETSPGTVFSRQRDAAFNGGAIKTAWNSWACPELPRRGSEFEDVLDEIYLSNPSMGYVLDIDYTRSEFIGSDLVGFAHERLDWWSPAVSVDNPISKDMWAATEFDSEDPESARIAFGVKFAPDGMTYSLVGCKQPKGGKAVVELIRTDTTELGTKDLAEWLHQRRAKASAVTIDGYNGAETLCDHLRDLGAPRNYVLRTNVKALTAATTTFMDALRTKDVRHVPDGELDESALKSIKRPIGKSGAWAFGSSQEASSLPIEACALAYWAIKNTKRNPKRKQRLL